MSIFNRDQWDASSGAYAAGFGHAIKGLMYKLERMNPLLAQRLWPEIEKQYTYKMSRYMDSAPGPCGGPTFLEGWRYADEQRFKGVSLPSRRQYIPDEVFGW